MGPYSTRSRTQTRIKNDKYWNTALQTKHNLGKIRGNSCKPLSYNKNVEEQVSDLKKGTTRKKTEEKEIYKCWQKFNQMTNWENLR
jgi:hypothetical protein